DVIAAGVLATRRHFRRIEVQIVRHEEVQIAVAVVVDPRATGSVAVPRIPQSRPPRDVREGAVAVVVKQNVLAPAGDEKVVAAVVIVIAYSNAGRPHTAAQ